MVGRLQVVLLSILPTGAALVYLYWMYGWKKPKSVRNGRYQKSHVLKVSCGVSEQDGDKVDSNAVPVKTPPVSIEQDSSAESLNFSGLSEPDDASFSLRLSSTDVKSLQEEQIVSATAVTCESVAEVRSADVDHYNTKSCHSLNISVSEMADNACKDEVLKCPPGSPRENCGIMSFEDDNCFDNCISGRNDDVDKVDTDSGCVRSDVASEECENGRRDSIESVPVRTTFLLIIHLKVICKDIITNLM